MIIIVENIITRFYAVAGFPGVIGAVDGTHISIQTPHREIEHAYVCFRKGGHSKNVQIVSFH